VHADQPERHRLARLGVGIGLDLPGHRVEGRQLFLRVGQHLPCGLELDRAVRERELRVVLDQVHARLLVRELGGAAVAVQLAARDPVVGDLIERDAVVDLVARAIDQRLVDAGLLRDRGVDRQRLVGRGSGFVGLAGDRRRRPPWRRLGGRALHEQPVGRHPRLEARTGAEPLSEERERLPHELVERAVAVAYLGRQRRTLEPARIERALRRRRRQLGRGHRPCIGDRALGLQVRRRRLFAWLLILCDRCRPALAGAPGCQRQHGDGNEHMAVRAQDVHRISSCVAG
jgi:hypothetical protein